MAWLVSESRVLASAEVAKDGSGRRRGLRGRDSIDGALVIQSCRWVHTFGMRFPIDVAFVDSGGVVVKIVRMPPGRLGTPVKRGSWVVEAATGAFERWGLAVGDVVELRDGECPVPRLVLVATPIGNLGDVSPRSIETLAAAELICCEDTRRTGRLLQAIGVRGKRLAVCNEHTERRCVDEVLAVLAAGGDVAVVTDAGTPGISDPGEVLVGAVLDAGYEVSTVPGPAALVAALVSSGLPTARFAFEGFLPRSGNERRRRLAEIAAERRTVILYEAPHRIARTIVDLTEACGPDRPVAVARELTKLYETIVRGTLGTVDLGDPRGEYVIVLAGAGEATTEVGDDALVAAIDAELAAGASRRDAADSVAATLGVPRRRAYDVATARPKRR